MINHWVKAILLIMQFFTHVLKNGSSNANKLATKVYTIANVMSVGFIIGRIDILNLL